MIRIVKDLLLNAAEKNAEKIGVIHKNEEHRYDAIYNKSECLASILVELGIKKGDRVCFFLEKRIEKIISIFGITIAGAIFVPIKRLLNNIQVVHILNDCNAKVLVTTASRVPIILKNKDFLNDLETIIYIGHSIKGFNDARIRCVEWDKAFENINIAGCKYPIINQYDIATVLYTSGSTGNAKGVVLSHKNIVEGAKVVSEYLEINNNDKILSILSFGFDYGLNQLTSAFLNVAQLIMLDYLFAKDIINEIYRSRITGLAAVSATWIKLLQEDWDENKTKSLRYITNSGGAIPEKYVFELRKKLRNA